MTLKRWNRSAAFVLLTLAILAASAATPAPARAAAFNVTKTTDTLDGACDRDCSLREAIVAANTAVGGDVVVVPAGLYILTQTGTDEDSSARGDLDIRGDLVLLGTGPAAGDTVVDGGGIDRVLDIPSDVTVDIQNLTIRNGRVGGPGAGIRSSGRLSVSRSIITGNTTTAFGFGGGIFTDGIEATLVLRESTLSSNAANGGGGGLAAGGTVTLSNVAVSTNRSETDFGGGLYIFSDGEGSINNATITGNAAAERGGGVLVESSAFLGVDQPEFSNTVIAGNTATIGDPDCSGAAASTGFNLIGIGGGCIGFTAVTNDQAGTAATPLNARLGPLGDNGGPTPTHPLLAGSPAIDTGNPATPGGGVVNACEPIDQRGVPRTASSGVRCDAGAFEVTSLCVTGGPNLCLNNGRFKVNVVWRTAQGQSGPGQAVRLTNDTGYFWFFQPSNVELTIKALDACAPPFNRFWVFLSGLTNVEVTVTVTDTVSGQVKTYTNPQGRRFRPVLDTDAFATCG